MTTQVSPRTTVTVSAVRTPVLVVDRYLTGTAKPLKLNAIERPVPNVFGEPAIMEARKRGFKYVWNSKLKEVVPLEEARQHPPTHIQLYNLNDELFR